MDIAYVLERVDKLRVGSAVNSIRFVGFSLLYKQVERGASDEKAQGFLHNLYSQPIQSTYTLSGTTPRPLSSAAHRELTEC